MERTPIIMNAMKIVDSILGGQTTSWFDFVNANTILNGFRRNGTNLVISASDKTASDRIGIKTLPRRKAITRDNA